MIAPSQPKQPRAAKQADSARRRCARQQPEPIAPVTKKARRLARTFGKKVADLVPGEAALADVDPRLLGLEKKALNARAVALDLATVEAFAAVRGVGAEREREKRDAAAVRREQVRQIDGPDTASHTAASRGDLRASPASARAMPSAEVQSHERRRRCRNASGLSGAITPG